MSARSRDPRRFQLSPTINVEHRVDDAGCCIAVTFTTPLGAPSTRYVTPLEFIFYVAARHSCRVGQPYARKATPRNPDPQP